MSDKNKFKVIDGGDKSKIKPLEKGIGKQYKDAIKQAQAFNEFIDEMKQREGIKLFDA
jgi:hypothetical protein